MHTHRRADSCQRAAVLHRGWRVKARPALASGSEDVAAQVLVLHQLAQVLVDVGAVDGDGAALVGRLEAQRVEQAFEHGVQAAGTDVLLALVDLGGDLGEAVDGRSEEHTSELQSLMRISYAVFCLKKKKKLLVNQQTNANT